jgi:hypothetical protein
MHRGHTDNGWWASGSDLYPSSQIYLLVLLPDYFMMVSFYWSIYQSASHISHYLGGGGWFWTIYLRGRRKAVAYLRQPNGVTEEQHCKPESEWPILQLGITRTLSKPCEYSAPIRHQSEAVNRHSLCPQRGSNPGSPPSSALLRNHWLLSYSRISPIFYGIRKFITVFTRPAD